MANNVNIKVLVDDAALDNLAKKANSSAKIIRGGFDLATGAAAVFGEQSAAAMEKLANRSILVANTMNGIEDLLDGIKENPAFLNLAQKAGVSKNAISGIASALPGIGLAITAVVAVWSLYEEAQARALQKGREQAASAALSIAQIGSETQIRLKESIKDLGVIDTIEEVDKAIGIYEKSNQDRIKDRVRATQAYNKEYKAGIGLSAANVAIALQNRNDDLARLELIKERNKKQEDEYQRLKNQTTALKNLYQISVDIQDNEVAIINLEKQKEGIQKGITAEKQRQKKETEQERKQREENEKQARILAEQALKEQFDRELAAIINLYDRIAFEQEKRGQDTKAVQIRSLEEQIALYRKYGLDTLKLERELFKLSKNEQKKNEPSQEQQLNQAYLVLFGFDKKTFDKAVEASNDIENKKKEQVDKQITTLQRIADVANSFSGLADQLFSNALSNIDRQTEAQLKSLDKVSEAALKKAGDNAIERARIEEDLANKRVAIEEEAEKKRKEIQKKQALTDLAFTIIQIGVETGLAIIKTAGRPGEQILNGILGATALATAIAAKSEILKLGKGGTLYGPSHAEGGIRGTGAFGGIEVEGGEMIINKRSARMYGPLLSRINQAGGGVPLIPTKAANGAVLPGGSFSDVDYDRLAVAIANTPIRAYVVTQDITDAQDKVNIIQRKANLF
jgi:hypothetical protein